MARFYGTVQGTRGEATRLGHKDLHVTAQSYNGDIVVQFFADATDKDVDHVHIEARPHCGSGSDRVLIYSGPVNELFKPEWRDALVRTFAQNAILDKAGHTTNRSTR